MNLIRGVSVISCTNNLIFRKNLFSNFMNQRWPYKELIIILNNDTMNLSEWQSYAKKYPHVSVYQLPQQWTLGACMNWAVHKARYNYIAKFDHDDYYAPRYLTEALQAFRKTNADVIGKRSYYIYFIEQKHLRLRFPAREHRRVPLIHGSTIIAKRHVLLTTPFVDIPLGEEIYFFRACRQKGYKIYSTSRYNYTYLRRNNNYHSWKADLNYLFKTSRKVAITLNYRKFANRVGNR